MLLYLTDNAPSVLQFDASVALEAGTAVAGKGRTYEKQVAYVGQFGKYDKAGSLVQSVPIAEGDLRHWADSINLQNARGVKVDLPIGHVLDDPEASRGSVLGATVKKDSKGRLSLYTTVKFRDGEAEKMANSAQVSLYQPLDYVDGKGNHYKRPIRHVCLTQDPVIPDLEAFTIAASLTPAPEVKPVTIHKTVLALAAKHSISTEGKNEDALEAELLALSLATEPAAPAAPAAPVVPPKATSPVTNLQLSGPIVKLLVGARTDRLAKLVDEGRITPATAKDLADQYCSEATAVALSNGTDDGFDTVVLALSKMEAKKVGESTGPQVLELTNVFDKVANPLLAHRQRQLEAAAAAKR